MDSLSSSRPPSPDVPQQKIRLCMKLAPRGDVETLGHNSVAMAGWRPMAMVEGVAQKSDVLLLGCVEVIACDVENQGITSTHSWSIDVLGY